MPTWLIPLSDMTPEQQRAIEFAPDRHRVIFGAPGSGKTMILLHRAAYLARKNNIRPERFRIFVFNNVLKNYIKSALGLLNIPEDNVLTYDHWCNLYYTTKINRRVPWDRQNGTPDYKAIRQAVYESVRAARDGHAEYDFVLVDEGQDLDPISFETIKRISHHVTVCMDNNQRIYENGADEDKIIRQLGLNKRNMSLLGAYRCCPYVTRLAAEFIDDQVERERYINQAKTDQTERQTPLLYYASGHTDEMRRLIEVIKSRQAKKDRIGIFFYQSRHVYGYAKGLMDAGLDVEVQKTMEQSPYKPLDFNSDRPKVLTYHSAKGLTFDTVIMPYVVERAFPKRNPASILRLLFVGTSRATKWIYMSTYEDISLHLLSRILPLAEEGCLTIQHSGQDAPSENQNTEQKKPEDLTDFL